MTLNNLNWSLEYYEEHIEECNALLKSLKDYEKILLLDSVALQTLTDGTLVRYRGMIQDIMNPEYYCCSFTVVNKESKESYVRSGKFRDIASCKPNEELNIKEVDFSPSKRSLYYCIPIPGTNDWVDNVSFFVHFEINVMERQKSIIQLKKTQVFCEPNSGPSFLKRGATDVDIEIDTSGSSPNNITKRIKSSEIKSDANSQSKTYSKTEYFPIPKENDIPCIIKVYEEEELGFRLNECVEVIGFLSLNPALEAIGDDVDAADKAIHPPPSLVPRIHVILINELKHYNPLLKEIISTDNFLQLAESARSDLHLILTQLLFEDVLAADYMICNLISKIYIRNEGIAIGKFSLNLFNISLKNFAEDFYNILKNLVTNSHYVALTTNFLNKEPLIPRKNYETDRLCSGLLQLPKQVHLVLDETKMSEGQLNNIGCSNVSALQKLFRDQEVYYDFGFYEFKFETDIPLLVISEGKSMFEADIKLRVKSELCTETNFNESVEAVRLYLKDDVLNKIRTYLTMVRLQDFNLSEEMVEKITGDYVSLRQRDKEFTSSDLHILLILSRLLALSHGRTVLQSDDWTRAVEMETERKSRLR